ncbi:taurine ABC transporter ATP-binding protein [Neomegalonema perideroedes]|uniref:taurine ABC transporter ATP-binding protein n=1 Tax=Neomegalonema perideroedes TaxID=217219 RepID=UPI00039C8A70
MSLLRLRRASLSYPAGGGGSVEVLRDVSLTIRRGEFVTVLGRSGAGKTSLLNLAAGFVAPSSGAVEVDGRPVSGPGADRAVVFQNDALLPWLDAAENVAFPLRLKGVGRAARLERAARLFRLVGLEGHERKNLWELSGGQRQRLGIARAIAAEPEFLLMDEPLGALDAMTRDRMQELLLKVWRASGAGALLITHSVEEALFLGTRVVVMEPHPGRIGLEEPLDFSSRFLEGASARALKAEPAFIAARERLIAAIHVEETALS